MGSLGAAEIKSSYILAKYLLLAYEPEHRRVHDTHTHTEIVEDVQEQGELLLVITAAYSYRPICFVQTRFPSLPPNADTGQNRGDNQ